MNLNLDGPLTRADAPLWAAARSVTDLAELTAQWLEGRIQSQPSYYGPCDVDEDDAPGLTDTLIALNRAGFLTFDSQAGFDGSGADGAHWLQYAAVTGFAHEDIVNKLDDLLVDGDWPYELMVTAIGGRHDGGVGVTFRGERTVTAYGRSIGVWDIGAEFFPGCGREAIEDVCRAWQVTIVADRPGRNDMWAVLQKAVQS